ncbi:hypothetical protein [Mesorhizobium argentiipisi]|uniref:Uncharacterized protein n=1 Tax=Mesorhizobium argentiipisi TaxID=3015175 RepID=A0ABU8K8Q9_9HYPH
MTFFAKKPGGLTSNRARADNDIQTHGNLSSSLMERREYRFAALKIARELPNLEQVLP